MFVSSWICLPYIDVNVTSGPSSSLSGLSCVMGISGTLRGKCHANHIMCFSSVVMGDKCFLSVHPPSPHPSIREHCLPKLCPRRRKGRDDKMERSTGESKKKREGMGGEKKTRCLRALLRESQEYSSFCLFRSQRRDRKGKCLL